MPTRVTDRVPAPATSHVAAPCTCADCGGLECLCRPRFFAGQLLTEEELNRLDHYIVAKNRLQNRHLHGWGVVCGLDVVCDDCSTGVIVKPGYALSPCGDDIVVCKDTPVDICSLIQACQKRERRGCDDMTASDRRTDAGCVEAGDWVLAITYAERPSRGVTPLRGGGCACGSGSAGGCGCGGKSSSGGCGCGGKSAGSSKSSSTGTGNGHSHGNGNGNGGCGCGGKASTATSSRFSSAARCTTPLECEPTVVCEEYRFEMYRIPPRTDERGKTQPGAMGERFAECLDDLAAALPEMPGTGSTQQQQHDWCCRTREGLLDYFSSHAVYDCSLLQRVRDIHCPAPNLPATQFDAEMLVMKTELLTVMMAALMACVCGVLMPPCPGEVGNARVPLAVVTVVGSGAKCRVRSVCNWTTERKYATTFPSLQYWLSILPFGRMLREALERVCCRLIPAKVGDDVRRERAATGAAASSATFRMSETGAPLGSPGHATASTSSGIGAAPATPMTDDTAPTGANRSVPTPASAFFASEPTIKRSQAFTRMAFAALMNRESSLDGETLLRGALGDLDDDERELPEEARENLLPFIALDQMLKPTLRTMLPREGGMGAVLSMVAALGGARRTEAAEPSGLADEVASLRETVERQKHAIDELRSRLDNR